MCASTCWCAGRTPQVRGAPPGLCLLAHALLREHVEPEHPPTITLDRGVAVRARHHERLARGGGSTLAGQIHRERHHVALAPHLHVRHCRPSCWCCVGPPISPRRACKPGARAPKPQPAVDPERLTTSRLTKSVAS